MLQAMNEPAVPAPAAALPPRPRWRGVLKWLLIALAILLLLPLALSLAGFAINAHDEAPAPVVAELLTVPPDPYLPDENLFVGFAGLSTPEAAQVTSAGVARIERYNARAQVLSAFGSGPDTEPPGSADLAFSGSLPFVQALAGSVWQDAPAHAAEVAKVHADNGELLGRYRALARRRGYFQTTVPSLQQPLFLKDLRSLRGLFLADAALRLRADATRTQAFEDVSADIELWHHVLTGYGDLLSKMLALAYLQADELLLADCAAHVPVGTRSVAVFPLQDFDIANAFAYEFRGQVSMLRELKRESFGRMLHDNSPLSRLQRLANWWSAHFYQVQATENLFAQTSQAVMALAAVSPANTGRLRTYGNESDPQQSALGARLAYNPVGKILASIWRPALRSYPLRAADGAAFQRLVRLGFEIRAAGIPPAGVPAFMEQHPGWSTHPGDGRRFEWLPATLELRMLPVAEPRPGQRLAIPVWPAPGEAAAPALAAPQPAR